MADIDKGVNTFIARTGSHAAAFMEACVHCGLCAEACHYHVATGDPTLTPIWKVELLIRAYKDQMGFWGQIRSLLGLEEKITESEMNQWADLAYRSCTMCNRCSMVCPMGIDITTLVRNVREAIVKAGLTPPDLMAITKRELEEGSPLGATKEVFKQRVQWLEDDMDIKLPMDKKGAKYMLLFSSIEIMKFIPSIAAVAKIFNAAGVSWTVSSEGYEGTNFGVLMGSSVDARHLVERGVNAAEALGVEVVVTPECGHSFTAFRWEAPNLMGRQLGFKVKNVTEVIAEFLYEGKIKLKPGTLTERVTFHDPCQLVRRGGLIEQHRDLLKAVASDFKEMTLNREKNYCCGGGGGVLTIRKADALRRQMFKVKIDQIQETGAKTLVTSCSSCRLTFLDGFAHHNQDIKMLGLADVVAEALVTD